MARTEKQIIGAIGEEISAKYLIKKGFCIVCRNYRKKYGEIDIIARKGEILHFIEVKTVSRENMRDVSRVTNDAHRPEDNIHPQKLRRIARTIQAYLLKQYPQGEPEWVFDAITVKLDQVQKKGTIAFLENLVL